jgi:hypothetical protein
MIKFRHAAPGIILVLAVLAVSGAIPLDYEYVGSKNASTDHYPTCRWARKIKPAHLVTFTSTREAQGAGYVRCEVCKPHP